MARLSFLWHLRQPAYRTADGVPVGSLALEFDGSADRVKVADDPLFELTDSLTLEAYVRLDAYPSSPYDLGQIVYRGDDQGGAFPGYGVPRRFFSWTSHEIRRKAFYGDHYQMDVSDL